MTEGALFDLLSWMSPAWPIGAFAHSSGLEWSVEEGLVHDRASTAAWLTALLEHGGIRNDAVLFVHAWRAEAAGDRGRLREVTELALASQTGSERRLESTAQGSAFRRIANATVETIPPAGEQSPDLAYPVAAATLFARQGIALVPALTAWLHGAIANLVSAAQRLVPLGQTDGQLVLRALRSAVLETAETLAVLPEGDPFEQLGGCTLLAELGCMAHETQYTRLFRT